MRSFENNITSAWLLKHEWLRIKFHTWSATHFTSNFLTVNNKMFKTERTALLTNETTPNYTFESSIARKRKHQVRQFQIFLCSMLLFVFILALIVLTSLSLDDIPSDDKTNSTNMSIAIDNILLVPGIIYCNFSGAYFNKTTEYMHALNGTLSELQKFKHMEKNNPMLGKNSPSYRHQMVTTASNVSKNLSLLGYMEEYASRNYYRDHKKIPLICLNNSQYNKLYISRTTKNCTKFEKYRSYDGSCNNLKFPFKFGVAYTAFRRVLHPDYADGISSPRRGVNNSLPSARIISNTVHRPYFRKDEKFTVMLAVFGQFLDHDITATASSRGANGTAISCCNNLTEKHPECFPVITEDEDLYYSNYDLSCMNFVRSAPAPTNCLGPRQQMNQVSAFIDGSTIYGSDDNLAIKLRLLKEGRFKVFITPDNRSLLPISDELSDGCNREDQRKQGRYCFMSGDARTNENLHLTTMHLIWTRHHNAMAAEIAIMNPHWNDEKTFQEVRKILIAQLQHIAYNEFLRVVIGEKIMAKHDLLPKTQGYYYNYDENLDPTIANNVATAAFRFGHSLIPTLIRFIGEDTSSVEYLKLHEILFDPFLLYNPGELDRVVKGAVHTEIQANDAYFTPEQLKQHLFERLDENFNTRKVCGLDLVSLNIQRGRDHGLPGYTNWREICSLSKPHTFDQLAENIDADTLNYIRSVYRNVEDVDLYSGALSERPMDDSMLGPTLNCLLIDQFIRLKRGDRHWYENPKMFTKEQLDQIRKSTLAKILCENSDNVTKIQSYVMENLRKDNEEVKCKELPSINLAPWREKIQGRVHVANQDMVIDTFKSPGTSGAVCDI